MRRVIITGLLVALGVAACSNATGQPPKPSEQETAPITPGVDFVLKAGQRAALNVDEVIISFVNVSEDSRCARDVQCIWAGQVTAVFRVVVGGDALGDKPLTLTGGKPSTVVVKGYTLALSAIDPYPVTTTPIKAADYQATLMLSLSR